MPPHNFLLKNISLNPYSFSLIAFKALFSYSIIKVIINAILILHTFTIIIVIANTIKPIAHQYCLF